MMVRLCDRLCDCVMCCAYQVVPYLLRRASENAFILKGAKADVRLLQAELFRRFLSPFKRALGKE